MIGSIVIHEGRVYRLESFKEKDGVYQFNFRTPCGKYSFQIIQS